MTGSGHCVVVGGGLAGITAAISLADRGYAVTLLESRPRLGGATTSFDRRGLTVDNGHHVFLRCYEEYRALLSRLRVADLVAVQPRLDIPVVWSGGTTHIRRGEHGPAPLHLLRALAGYSALTSAERARAVGAANAMRRVDPDDPATDATTLGDWLRRHGQSRETIRKLWGLVTVAALNIDPDRASLALAARVFRTGLLDTVTGGDLGLPQSSLGALHDDPAQHLLQRLGVRVSLRSRVQRIEPTASGLSVQTGDEELAADAVVCAVPHRQAAKVLPPAAAAHQEDWTRLGESPIVNVHVHYDRRVLPLPLMATPDSSLQFLFDKTSIAGVDHGQYVVASVSAADDVIGTPTEDVLAAALPELTRVLPDAGSAQILDAFVTREPAATFRQLAGTAALRPPAATSIPGLALAGAWTATGWPDTMEGAVRSGHAAVEAVVDQAARNRTMTEVSA